MEIKVEKKDANAGALQQNDQWSTGVNSLWRAVASQSLTRLTSGCQLVTCANIQPSDTTTGLRLNQSIVQFGHAQTQRNFSIWDHKVIFLCLVYHVACLRLTRCNFPFYDRLLLRRDGENPVWRLQTFLLYFHLCRRFEFMALSARWHNQILLQWDFFIKRMT